MVEIKGGLTMETLFRKVLVSERVPTTHNSHFTNKGELHLIGGKWKQWWQGDQFIETTGVEWFLEEIQLPSEDDIEDSGKEGGLCDNELQMYWEGAVWLKKYILGFINNKK